MRENYTEIGERVWNVQFGHEGLYSVDRVERDPADDEEENDDGEVLRGFHFTLLRSAEHAQHRAARCTPLAAFHCYHRTHLKVIK